MKNLQTMSQAEPTELRNDIDFALAEKSIAEDPDVIDFYEWLDKALDFLVGKPLPPLSVLKEKYPEFYKELVVVTRYINEHMSDDGRYEYEKKNRFRIYVRLVTSYLGTIEKPINLGNILSFHDTFPSLVDDAFPAVETDGEIRSDEERKEIDREIAVRSTLWTLEKAAA